MANTISISDLAAKSAVKGFFTKGKICNTVDRSWEPEFKQTGYDPGTTVRLRRPTRFTAVQSSIATPQNIAEDTVSVTMLPYNVSTPWTDLEKQLSLRPEKLEERVFKPMVNALISKAEIALAQAMAIGSTLDAGNTPGSIPGNFRTASDGMARIMEQRIPDDEEIFGAYTYSALSALLDNTKNLPNPSTQISNQFLTGKLKNIAGVNMFGTPSVFRLQNGTAINSSSPTINGAVSSGSTVVMASVGNNLTVKAGMAFTVAGVFEVDPQTFTPLVKLKVFRVAADATASGAGALTVTVTDPIYSSGTQQNVSIALPNSAAVLWYNGTTASASSYQNLIYSSSSTAAVFLPPVLPQIDGLAKIRTYDGIPVKAEFWRDGGNHQEFLRMDILLGIKVVRPGWIATAWGE